MQLFLVRAFGLAVVFWSPLDQVGSVAGEAQVPKSTDEGLFREEVLGDHTWRL